MKLRLSALLSASAIAVAGCGDVPVDPSSEDGLSTATGQVATIEWDAYVDVAPDADVATIQRAIQRQVKSAIGALRQPEVAIQDRDALRNSAPDGWRRETLTVAGTSTTVLRVRYHYRDNALVRVPITNAARPAPNTQPSRTLQLTLLAGDYVARADALRPVCSDDPRTEADSLWFHYAPHLPTCQQAIRAEATAINAASAMQRPAAGQVTRAEVDRRFLTVRADLRPQATPAATTKYPEYHRLWGLDSDRAMLVVYAFFGVDNNLRDSRDNSLVEFMRFVSTVRTRFPGLQVTDTRPYASLLDFNINGTPINASYADVTRWIVDGQAYPAAASTDAQREQLRQQVIDRFAERWIYWSLPVRVTRGNVSRDVTLQIRTYWGYEDGTPERRQAARWRYLEGMWHGDVFVYQGHSHFGHGPLEPTGYNGGNFPSDRYQVMLVNSCVSFNYYDEDFLAMHPGGSRNLDMIVNGLPAYWTRLGEATARAVLGLVDGENKTWDAILRSMVVTPSWAPRGYDPLRAVNGELDNEYNPAAALGGPLRVTPR